MGVVYRAIHGETGERVALKVLLDSQDSPEISSRFRREVQALARIVHPSVVRILGESLDHCPPYFVMELLEGGALSSRLDLGGLPPAKLAGLAIDLASALAAAHAEKILHRDIKPHNVLFSKEGQAKLADFGMAKALDLTGLTLANQVMGTLPYMAPETLRGRPADTRTDLYQLGVTLFEAGAGQKPYDGETLLRVAAGQPLPPLPDLRALSPGSPPWFQDVLVRLMQTDPDERYPSAAALFDDLKRAVSGKHSRPPPAPTVPTPTALKKLKASPRARERESRSRSPSIKAVFAVASAVAALALIGILTSRPSSAPPPSSPEPASARSEPATQPPPVAGPPPGTSAESVRVAKALASETLVRAAISPSPDSSRPALDIDLLLVGASALLGPRLELSGDLESIEGASLTLVATPPVAIGKLERLPEGGWESTIPAGALRDGYNRFVLTPRLGGNKAKVDAQLRFARPPGFPWQVLAGKQRRPDGPCPPKDVKEVVWSSFREGHSFEALKLARSYVRQYPACEEVRLTHLYYLIRLTEILSQMSVENFGLVASSFIDTEMQQVPAWKVKRELHEMLTDSDREHPFWPRLWYLYGEWMRQAGERPESLRACRWGVLLEPEYGEQWVNLAEAEVRAAMPKGKGTLADADTAGLRAALDHAAMAVETGGPRTHWFERSELLHAQLLDFVGREAEARAAYARVLAANPRQVSAAKALERLKSPRGK